MKRLSLFFGIFILTNCLLSELFAHDNGANLFSVLNFGAVLVFSSHAGSYSYITRMRPDQKNWNTEGADLSFDNEGHAVIKTKFTKAEAKIIFFEVN